VNTTPRQSNRLGTNVAQTQRISKITPLRKDQRQLTHGQRRAAYELATDYITAILSTQPVDEAQIEQAVADAYRAAGEMAPLRVRWFDSPLAFVMARGAAGATVGENLRDRLRSPCETGIGENVADRVYSNIKFIVRGHLRERVTNAVGETVRASVYSSLRSAVGNTVGATVAGRVSVPVMDTLWETPGAGLAGSLRQRRARAAWASVAALYDASRLAVYQFYHEHLTPNALAPLIVVNRATHGYFFGRGEAWLVRRATRLERDEVVRLHSEDGMAIQYADGWGFYAWHGVSLGALGEKLIMAPETLTREDWSSEPNAEVRRVIHERLGTEHFLALVGAKTIHCDECGELVEVELPHDPERVARYVHVKDSSTERRYYLRVPPTIKRARQAVAWTFDIPEAEYCPLQEA